MARSSRRKRARRAARRERQRASVSLVVRVSRPARTHVSTFRQKRQARERRQSSRLLSLPPALVEREARKTEAGFVASAKRRSGTLHTQPVRSLNKRAVCKERPDPSLGGKGRSRGLNPRRRPYVSWCKRT